MGEVGAAAREPINQENREEHGGGDERGAFQETSRGRPNEQKDERKQDSGDQLGFEGHGEKSAGDDFSAKRVAGMGASQDGEGGNCSSQSGDFQHAGGAEDEESGRGNEEGKGKDGGEQAMEAESEEKERGEEERGKEAGEEARPQGRRVDMREDLRDKKSQQGRLIVPHLGVKMKAMEAQRGFGQFKSLVGSEEDRRAQGEPELQDEEGRQENGQNDERARREGGVVRRDARGVI